MPAYGNTACIACRRGCGSNTAMDRCAPAPKNRSPESGPRSRGRAVPATRWCPAFAPRSRRSRLRGGRAPRGCPSRAARNSRQPESRRAAQSSSGGAARVEARPGPRRVAARCSGPCSFIVRVRRGAVPGVDGSRPNEEFKTRNMESAQAADRDVRGRSSAGVRARLLR